MPTRPLVRAFLTFYVCLGVVVALESVLTVSAALRGEFSPHDRPHALVLGSLETLAAVMFLVPRAMRWGAAMLLIIFTIAFLIHLIDGHPNPSPVIYAAGVLFVRIHGVSGYRWTPRVA